jgi:predicted RNA-binding protein YlqC (UPF0109 family)
LWCAVSSIIPTTSKFHRSHRRQGETTYRIGLHPADVGLVIGKGGRTISAIRSLINAANGHASGRRSRERQIAVEVVENS